MLVQARGSLGAVAVILALMPSALRAESFPTMPAEPAFGPETPAARCVAVDQGRDRQGRKKARRGVLGWLYRYTRNIDMERGSTPLPPFLRSPLLTAIPTATDCESEGHGVRPAECAAIVVAAGKEETVTSVSLPQLGASTPARLADAVRSRLSDGQTVDLATSGGGTLKLLPREARHVDARNCVVDA